MTKGVTLLQAVTVTGAGAGKHAPRGEKSFQAIGSVASSTGAVTVAVQVSNDGINWLTLGQISLSLTTSESSDGFVSSANWTHVRGNVISISGTGAAVSLLMGV